MVVCFGVEAVGSIALVECLWPTEHAGQGRVYYEGPRDWWPLHRYSTLHLRDVWFRVGGRPVGGKWAAGKMRGSFFVGSC